MTSTIVSYWGNNATFNAVLLLFLTDTSANTTSSFLPEKLRHCYRKQTSGKHPCLLSWQHSHWWPRCHARARDNLDTQLPIFLGESGKNRFSTLYNHHHHHHIEIEVVCVFMIFQNYRLHKFPSSNKSVGKQFLVPSPCSRHFIFAKVLMGLSVIQVTSFPCRWKKNTKNFLNL